jgi:hypothetical protein
VTERESVGEADHPARIPASRATGVEKHLREARYSDGPLSPAVVGGRESLINPDRLSFWLKPEAPLVPGELAARTVIYSAAGSLFVADSSFFDASIDEGVWRGLLARPEQVLVLPQVHEELTGWRAKIPEHPAAVALREERFGAIKVASWQSSRQTAFLYYVNLLGIRKRLYRVAELQLQGKLGREPTPDELLQTKREISHILGPRAVLLARKGAKADPQRATYATDEILTVTAFMLAIDEGRRVVILTRDGDLLELCYKLQWMLDTQYRGWYLAERYVRDGGVVDAQPMPRGVPWSEAFDDEGENHLVAWKDADPEAVRAEPATPVAIECWLIRSGDTRAGFGVEAGMQNLLDAKGATGGLNNIALAPRNYHVWLAPLPIPQQQRSSSAVASDLRWPIAETDVSVPLLDINQSILTEERFRAHDYRG